MGDFQTVKKRGHNSSNNGGKYSDELRQLTDMGFDSTSATTALEINHGNFEAAMAYLIGEGNSVGIRMPTDKKADSKGKLIRTTTAGSSNQLVKNIKEVHQKMMATYKVQKCKEVGPHDRKMCMGYHSNSDRRRNPFECVYSCYECPNAVEGSECSNGDSCSNAHTLLERMFHPELYKISNCQRLASGIKCDRGVLCAFAHSEADMRISPSHLTSKPSAQTDAKAVAQGKSAMLDNTREKVVSLIKEYGVEGILGSDLPSRFAIRYHESLDVIDETGAKYKLRDIIGDHPHISVVLSRGVAPKYVYDESRTWTEDPVEIAERAKTIPIITTISEKSSSSESKVDSSPSVSSLLTKVEKVKSLYDELREKVYNLIKTSGRDGVLGSELPLRYAEAYKQKLEMKDSNGSKLKLKELIMSLPGIVIQTYKLQPKYVYDPEKDNSESIEATESAAASVTSNGHSTVVKTAVSVGRSYLSAASNNATTAASTISNSPEIVSPAVSSTAVDSTPSQSTTHHTNGYMSNYEEELAMEAAFSTKTKQAIAPVLGDHFLSAGGVSPPPSLPVPPSFPGLSKFGTSQAVAPVLTVPSHANNGASLSMLIAAATSGSSSEANAMNEKISLLEKELAAKKADSEQQLMQMRLLHSKIAELEAKHQKDEEMQLKLVTGGSKGAVEEEMRRAKEEKLRDLDYYFRSFGSIEEAINQLKCKEEYFSDKVTAEDIQEMFQLKKMIKSYVGSVKSQLKATFDVVNAQLVATKRVEPVSAPPGIDASTVMTAAGMFPMQVPAAVVASPASSRFFAGNGGFTVSAAIAPIAPAKALEDPFMSRNMMLFPQTAEPVAVSVDVSKLCGQPGCMLDGLFTCAGCRKVSYCGADHQKSHWAVHSQQCYGAHK
jgi:hypothetical protein